jgi:hypothetical protein
MKNFLSAFLFFLLFSEMKVSYSQSYHSFPDTLSEWSEGSRYCYVSGPRSCSGSGYIYTLWGDTLIGGLTYKLIGYNEAYIWDSYGSVVNYPYQSPGQIFGALREDITHKVWFRNFDSLLSWVGCLTFYPSFYPVPIDSDLLLYDFGLGVGDTAYWTGYQYNVVKKIDSIQLLDGSWRRVISFDTVLSGILGPDYWIEGIGSHWGLFGPYCVEAFEEECNLICFKNADTLLLENQGFYVLVDCNHIYTSTLLQTVNIHYLAFPNPANDYIAFDLSNFTTSDCEITIYNSTGQLLKDFSSHHSTQLKIPVDEIGSDGMYFYTVRANSEKLFAGKFLIQRK